MKRWQKLFLALECLHLAIECAKQVRKLLKEKKKKREKDDKDST